MGRRTKLIRTVICRTVSTQSRYILYFGHIQYFSYVSHFMWLTESQTANFHYFPFIEQTNVWPFFRESCTYNLANCLFSLHIKTFSGKRNVMDQCNAFRIKLLDSYTTVLILRRCVLHLAIAVISLNRLFFFVFSLSVSQSWQEIWLYVRMYVCMYVYFAPPPVTPLLTILRGYYKYHGVEREMTVEKQLRAHAYCLLYKPTLAQQLL